MSILDLFCSVDEFWQPFAPWWQRPLLASIGRSRCRAPAAAPDGRACIPCSDPAHRHPRPAVSSRTIIGRARRSFSTQHVQPHLRAEFPHLVSDSRFGELLPTVLVPLIVYLHTTQHAVGRLHRPQRHRLDGARRLP